jgi:hemerythrin
MRKKLKFALDNIRSTEELIDSIVVQNEPLDIGNGATIHRVGFNLYEFKHDGETLTVDLNLEKNSDYQPSYRLNHHQITKEYFSIIHSGEGDGWDMDRPCMASIITFQGKIFLVDAGPNLMYSLRALGIGITEIDGIFQTHAHDDHFAGLTALLCSDHKIKYYAAPTVRASTMKKFCALLAIGEDQFQRFFDVQDLNLDEWNNIDGLEVRPTSSPHPVETTILFFRTLWGSGYKSYAHLADIVSLPVFEAMIEEDPDKSGISRDYYNKIKSEYLTPVTVKKVDIGGGMIHGDANDFRMDTSEKIILSHTATALSDVQREIGSNASFGIADVLIPSTQDYTKQKAFHHLSNYFPTAPKYELQMFLNCPAVDFNPGTIIFKNGQFNNNVYLILSGILEVIPSNHQVQNILNVGSFVGEFSDLLNNESSATYRAISHTKALEIPNTLYLAFLKRNHIYESVKENIEKQTFLQKTWLFGEQVFCTQKNTIISHMEHLDIPQGWNSSKADKDNIHVIDQGEFRLLDTNGCIIEILHHGDFFGEEHILQKSIKFHAIASKDSSLWKISARAFQQIPIVHWKLTETFERRQKKF